MSKQSWDVTRWEIRTASCTITLSSNAGGLMFWDLCTARPGPLVSGQFQTSGNVNADLKTAQAAAVDALNVYSKTVTGYASEVSAL